MYERSKSLIFDVLDVIYASAAYGAHPMRRVISRLESRYFARQFATCGSHSAIGRPAKLSNPQWIEIGDYVEIMAYSRWDVFKLRDATTAPRVIIGEGSSIGHYFVLGCVNCVEIGRHSLIAPSVLITDAIHNFENPTIPVIKQYLHSKGPVIIEDGCWLGYGCAVLSGVRIGRNSIIGANAVVTHDIPERSIAVGVPARVTHRYDPVKMSWVRVQSDEDMHV